MFTKDTVTVVTATTGHPSLGRCLESVQAQSYPRVEHFVIADGAEHQAKMHQAIASVGKLRRKMSAMSLPHATGKKGWCGHRIYAAASFLCNSEFICYLDEDNWFEPEHVQTMMAAIQAQGATWGFALRRIFDSAGNFVALDECDSLGNLHPTFSDDSVFLIDTNCFMLRRDVAVIGAAAWYRPVATPKGELPADKKVTRMLLDHFPKVCSNLRHTVNYTAGNNPNSVQADFFIHGNRRMRERYLDGLPWKTDPPDPEL